jgi:hypothetical protein
MEGLLAEDAACRVDVGGCSTPPELRTERAATVRGRYTDLSWADALVAPNGERRCTGRASRIPVSANSS